MKIKSIKQKFRQTIKTTLVLLFFTGICLPINGQQQSNKTKVDYSKKSNILNPDTLLGDQKKIFWHTYFLKLTSEEAKNIEPLKIKAEFEKLGITTKENDRFVDAYSFFDAFIVYHKNSCENWEIFKDLTPKSE